MPDREAAAGGGLPGFLSVGLALLRAVDPVEADALSFALVEHVERITIQDTDYRARELTSERWNSEKTVRRASQTKRIGHMLAGFPDPGERLTVWEQIG
jgi:hypothetical protein